MQESDRSTRTIFQFCKDFNTCVDKVVEIAFLRRLTCLSSIVFTALHNFCATPRRAGCLSASERTEEFPCGASRSVPLGRSFQVNLDHLLGFGDVVPAPISLPAR